MAALAEGKWIYSLAGWKVVPLDASSEYLLDDRVAHERFALNVCGGAANSGDCSADLMVSCLAVTTELQMVDSKELHLVATKDAQKAHC